MTELKVHFRDSNKSDEWTVLHPKLKIVFETLAIIMMRYGLDIEITSMLRPAGTISGESGVHATGRALDCVPRLKKGGFKTRIDYPFMSKTAAYLSVLFTRSDQHQTVIWHDTGTGFHFHLQVQIDRAWVDLKGVMPEEPVKTLDPDGEELDLSGGDDDEKEVG